MESQAEALNQLTADELDGKFAMLETSSTDDDLTKLKMELSGGSLKAELPAGRTENGGSKSVNSIKDLKIESELDDLRIQAKEY